MIESSQLGLATRARDNPFAVHRTESLTFRFPAGTWRDNLDRLASLKYRAAIVGPQGSGKTTLLYELAKVLQEMGLRPELVRATHDRAANDQLVGRLLNCNQSNRIILLDSAEQLSRFQWYQLVARTRRRCGLIVTVHRRCILPTWVRCRVSLDLTKELLVELGFSESEAAVLAAEAASYALQRGNLRNAFRSLYDAFAEGKLAIK